MAGSRRISVIGLGYVGLPVAVAFGAHGRVIGYDISTRRVEELRGGHDHTGEVTAEELAAADIKFTSDVNDLRAADFHIIAVPTPIDDQCEPDLAPLRGASSAVGSILKRGDIVVFESTVYPGTTEEICVPLLEEASGLRHGEDFNVGYSPERINPGDRGHRLASVVKVVAGDTPATLETVAQVYGQVVIAGLHRAPSIKVAEAAKAIENTQRDLNIALMNELAVLFERLDIDTADVIDAAASKWNFVRFTPGLVGGHCIGVDPYYLTHKARAVGYTPQVILAGRAINDHMSAYLATRLAAVLKSRSIAPKQAVVTILGITFKENVPDTRNTAVADLARALARDGITVQVHDPLADQEECRHEYGIGLLELDALQPADAVVLAVPHAAYRQQGWNLVSSLLRDSAGVVYDVKSVLDRGKKPDGITLLRL